MEIYGALKVLALVLTASLMLSVDDSETFRTAIHCLYECNVRNVVWKAVLQLIIILVK